MTKKDLKSGMMVKFRDDDNLFVVMEDCDTFNYGHQKLFFYDPNKNNFMIGDILSDDLIHGDKNDIEDRSYDIVKIYDSDNYLCCDDIIDETKLKLLWERKDELMNKYKCPKCGGSKFAATAHVTQDWELDENGEFIKSLNDCVETTHRPTEEDIWDCMKCGHSAEGKEFNSTSHK